MFEEGIVKKIKNKLAFVEIKRSSKCEGCKLCAFGANKTIVWPAIMKTECGVGDNVVLEMPSKTFTGASVLLFLIPLVLFAAGLGLGMLIGELYMILFGFIFAGFGVLVSFFVDKSVRRNPKYAPVVVERILNIAD